MAKNTAIEWCDHTFNPWQGCTKISPGCDYCYAEARQDTRLHAVKWGAGQPRKRTKTWGDPVKWNAGHAEFFAQHGRRQRVFCASLADVLDNQVPLEWRADLFELIRATPHLDWLLLTKRIGNAMKMLPWAMEGAPGNMVAGGMIWPNVWIGATVVNQEEADRDIPKLLAVPAAVRFLSMEPLLGPVDLRYLQPGDPPTEINALAGTHGVLRPHRGECPRLDWVIVGGESGPMARPMHPDWARSLRDQCVAAGVPFLFKQWGEHTGGELAANPDYPGDSGAWRLDQRGNRWHALEESGKSREEWKPVRFVKCGKKAAGRLLDGVTHDAFPEARP